MTRGRILLADDREAFRRSVASYPRPQDGVEVVAESSDGLQATGQAEEQHPDLVLTDLNIRHCNGFEATRDRKAHSSKTIVIILSMHPGEEYKRLAFQNQADGYIEKDGALKKLHALMNQCSDNVLRS